MVDSIAALMQRSRFHLFVVWSAFVHQIRRHRNQLTRIFSDATVLPRIYCEYCAYSYVDAKGASSVCARNSLVGRTEH